MKTVLVTGNFGMVGKAVCDLFNSTNNYRELNLRLSYNKNEHDLRKEQTVRSLYELVRPDYVIHCAAVVGGVKFNKEQPDILFRDNLLMNTHMVHYAHHYGVKKFIGFSSACAFQDGIYPFKEDNLQEGRPYIGNLAYGYAKRMVDIQIGIYNQLYNRKDLTVIPVSIYGPNDNFNLENGHFIASLIRKAYEAKKTNTSLKVWGDGSPMRELLYVKDLAKILIELLFLETPDKLIIPGQEVSIFNTVMAIIEIIGFCGDVEWEKDKSVGQYKKPTDPTRFKQVLGDYQFTNYREGLRETIEWYVNEKDKGWHVRGE